MSRSSALPSALIAVVSLALPMAGSSPISAGEHFRTIPAVAFQAISGWDITGLDSPGHFSRHCDANPLTPACSFVADAELPHGAAIIGLEIDACDNSTYWNLRFQLLEVNTNEFLSGGTAAHDVVITGIATDGCEFTTAAAQVQKQVNQFATSYVVVVSVEPFTFPGPLPCGPLIAIPCAGSSTRFNAVRVYYEPNEGGVVEPSKPLSAVFFP